MFQKGDSLSSPLKQTQVGSELATRYLLFTFLPERKSQNMGYRYIDILYMHICISILEYLGSAEYPRHSHFYLISLLTNACLLHETLVLQGQFEQSSAYKTSTGIQGGMWVKTAYGMSQLQKVLLRSQSEKTTSRHQISFLLFNIKETYRWLCDSLLPAAITLNISVQ